MTSTMEMLRIARDCEAMGDHASAKRVLEEIQPDFEHRRSPFASIKFRGASPFARIGMRLVASNRIVGIAEFVRAFRSDGIGRFITTSRLGGPVSKMLLALLVEH
jgi:hypothetical protein